MLQIIGICGIIIGIIFTVDLLVTVFGGINPGKARKLLTRVSIFGMKVFIVYLVAMLIFTVFSGLSMDRSVHSVLGNIFAVILAVLFAAVFLSDFFPSKDDK